MVVNDKLRRNIEDAINDKRQNEMTEDSVPTERIILQDKARIPASTQENDENSDKHDTKQSCHYKPLPSSKLRHRKQAVSMFEIQPKKVKEIAEVQEICIETGLQQFVKRSVTVLPELSGSSTVSDPVPTSSETNFRQITENPIAFRGTSQSQDSRKVVVGKDNEWMGLDSKLEAPYIPRIPSCPTIPSVSNDTRRRSLGVLTTPAWGLRTYRDPHKPESRTSPSLRRRSLVLPGHHVQDKLSPSSTRKYLISPEVSELTTREDFVNRNKLSNSAEELSKDQKRKLDFEKESKPQNKNQKDIDDQALEKQASADPDYELRPFRPRLRSRSLNEYRTHAREHVLQNLQLRCLNEPDKRRENRRKSFEVWLTEKEQETVKRLHQLTLEKQRTTEDEARRKEQRRGKTYEEWLNEKNNMACWQEDSSEKQKEQRRGKTYEEWLNEKNNMAAVGENSSDKRDETMKVASQGRQEIAQRRYDKWLMEKEAQSLEKEREMLKQAKLKTIEMRKKHEEKKRNKLKIFGTPFS